MPIRTLRNNEPIPEFAPSRYHTSAGYVVLRWHLGAGDYVEIYEHRLLAGRPNQALHVHHINGDKADNRPENLEVCTAQEHRRKHVSWDVGEAVRLFLLGHGTPAIGKRVGVDASQVFRVLKKMGHTRRLAQAAKVTPNHISPKHRAKLCPDDVREIRANTGVQCPVFARKFGVTKTAVWYARTGRTWRDVS